MLRKERVYSSENIYRIIIATYFILLTGFIWIMQVPVSYAAVVEDTVIVHITGAAHPPGFQPDLVTVHVNDTIVFINDAQPAAAYTVAATDHSFVSPSIASGQQWSVTIAAAGTYEYRTLNTDQSLVGAIVVAPASIKLLPTPDPGAVATAIAVIQVGQPQRTGPAKQASPGFSPALAFLLITVALLVVAVVVAYLLFLRRRRLT